MPFLHLATDNRHQPEWRELVKDHPAGFEVLEWSTEQERDHLYRSQPNLDAQLYPRICVSIVACLQKLVDYGGITVRGEETRPVRGLRTILNDWRTLGPPKRLTVRGYAYPVFVDKTTIMSCDADDTVCKRYRDSLVEKMIGGVWEHPSFDTDVAIM